MGLFDDIKKKGINILGSIPNPIPEPLKKVDTANFTPLRTSSEDLRKMLSLGPPIKNPLQKGGPIMLLSDYPKTDETFTPAVLSSRQGADIVNQDVQSLRNIEQKFTPAGLPILPKETARTPEALLGRTPLPGSAAAQRQTVTAEQAVRLTGDPRTQSMINDINSVANRGGLTSDQVAGLSNVQGAQDDLDEAVTKANSALDSKDFKSFDFWVKKSEENRKKFEDQLTQYFKDVAPLRLKRGELLTPGAREQELRSQLNTIRSEAEQFTLQTEKDKFAEFEGQTLGFAKGRAAEIDLKASFGKQEMALKEKNILLELGLEQEAREMGGKAIDQQLDDFSSDFDLRTKIEDRLNKQEDDLFDRANTLRDDAKSVLFDILKQMEGINPDEMSPESVKKIETLARDAGIDLSLVQEGLKAQYQRQVFDDAVKLAKEKRSERAQERAEEQLSISERRLELAEEAGKRAEEKVSGRQWDDEEFRIKIRSAQEAGLNKQEILDELEIDTTIGNKARGRLIINELIPDQEESEDKGFWSRIGF